MTITEKHIPLLRFPEFEGRWNNIKLGDLLTFKNGINADKDKYGSGIKFINVLDIINNPFITYNNILGSVEITKSEFEKNEVNYGDILFQRSSETREEVGQANVYLDRKRSAVFGGFVIRGKKKKEYDPMFMNFLLKTWLARKEITTRSGGSTRYNVGQDTLRQVVVFLTSIPEQQKIADFFSAVDKKIELLTRKKELLEQYKKGVMQKVFSQEIRFKRDDGSDFPNWEEKRLGEVFNYKNGGSFENDITENGQYYLITLNSIDIEGKLKQQHKKINITDNSLAKGDIVMVLSDIAHGNLLGLTAIIPANNRYVLNQRMGALKIKTNDNLIFLNQYLNFNQKYFKLHGQGSSQLNLSKGDILKFVINLPVLLEQKKIAKYLSKVDDKINNCDEQITQIQQFKKGLLQQMFV